jgi:hypothetical protein
MLSAGGEPVASAEPDVGGQQGAGRAGRARPALSLSIPSLALASRPDDSTLSEQQVRSERRAGRERRTDASFGSRPPLTQRDSLCFDSVAVCAAGAS